MINKKRLFLILILFPLLLSFLFFSGKIDNLFKVNTVRAFGDLFVDFHVPSGNPIFTVNNMVPGDIEERSVDVVNSGFLTHVVAVKGTRTGGVGIDPKLETVFDLVISDGSNVIYGSGSVTGAKTLKNFFDESGSINGIELNSINPSAQKTYTFKIAFPASAGNDFRLKSVVFDLVFGIVTGNDLVINEVYYRVDSTHGLDSPKDRGILKVNGSRVTLVNKDTGPGSVNTIIVTQIEACKVLNNSMASVYNNVNINTNTGSNSHSSSGNASVSINITNNVNTNISTINCGNMLGQNDEWVEIFNPTNHDISLRNWSLTDNSGVSTIIKANKVVKAGGFALIMKDASTKKYWNTHNTQIIELGNQIGDGLDNSGDRLILKNPNGKETDRVSWGSDTSGFTPPATNPEVSIGDSTERLVPGYDTDKVSDWKEENPPTPGQ